MLTNKASFFLKVFQRSFKVSPKVVSLVLPNMDFKFLYSCPRVPVSPWPRVPVSPCPRVPMSPCPRVPMSPCPRVPMSPCPRVPMSLCPHAMVKWPHIPVSPSPCIPMSLRPHVPVSPCPCVPMSPCPRVPMSPCPRVSMSPCPHVPVSPCPCIPPFNLFFLGGSRPVSPCSVPHLIPHFFKRCRVDGLWKVRHNIRRSLFRFPDDVTKSNVSML